MAEVTTDGAPVISLGGKEFPIPQLAAKQNRIIDPLILSLTPFFVLYSENRTVGMTNLSSKDYDALQDIAYTAVTRAHPRMKKDEFLELPISLTELMEAFPIVAKQTGIFAAQKSGNPAGEESAGKPAPQTGIAS